MKKVITGALLLMSIQFCNAQEPFSKKYTSMISMENYVKGSWLDIDLTVVFNNQHKRDIVFYYLGGKKIVFHQISKVTESTTTDGSGFQMIDCIDQNGDNVTLQLFDDDKCLRVLISKGYFVEFHND